MKKKGLYIVFEGIVGCGKTVQSRLLANRLREEYPRREVLWTREPGGSEIAGQIRKIVQATEFEEEIDPICEAYLYAASRAHTLRRVVAPVIKRHGIVISDRSYLTSVAYQGAARGLDPELVLEINKVAVDGMIPDAVFFLDVTPGVALARSRDKLGDKFERYDVDFYIRAIDGYEVAQKMLKDVWHRIDGSNEIDKIHDKIWDQVLKLLHEPSEK
ncbi:dTMP kinase [Candidatus Microgenomates bacterium]|nr:dTMP kinase [Candidatus Microgenomates bacterium]